VDFSGEPEKIRESEGEGGCKAKDSVRPSQTTEQKEDRYTQGGKQDVPELKAGGWVREETSQMGECPVAGALNGIGARLDRVDDSWAIDEVKCTSLCDSRDEYDCGENHTEEEVDCPEAFRSI